MERAGNGGQRSRPPPIRPDGSDCGKGLVEETPGIAEAASGGTIGCEFGENEGPIERVREFSRFLAGAGSGFDRARLISVLSLHGGYGDRKSTRLNSSH